MNRERVRYEDLSPKQQEDYNFAKLAGVLADYGFTCTRITADWKGPDLLAHHFSGETLQVQLKGRLTVCQKYIGTGLFIAFPIDGTWYLLEHDELLALVGRLAPSWLQSEAWRKENGEYHSGAPSAVLREALSRYRLEDLSCSGYGPPPEEW